MSNPPPAPKVAIPRLESRDRDGKFPHGHGKVRVQQACDMCRRRKVRCSGEQPQCGNCRVVDEYCTYAQSRKDRLKKSTEQNNQLVALLKDLSIQVDDSGQQRINELLDALGDETSTATVATGTLGERSKQESPSGAESQDEPGHGEADVTGSVGSNEDVDRLDEDLFRSRESRATGFVGQNSEVQWLRSLKTNMENPGSTGFAGSRTQLPYGRPGNSNEAVAHRADAARARQKSSQSGSIRQVSNSTFYLDSDDLKVDVAVDPYQLPPPERAEKLFDCYMQTIHTTFPILPDEFDKQFRDYNDSVKRNKPYQVPEDWQAILNLVFAIGAQHSHLTQADWRTDERDHLIYMTRAIRILGFNDMATVLSAPTLSSIQATGLLSLYYLTIGQVSRAWMMIGISLRLALAVGLHLRNDDPSASLNRKENLIRTWWALYSIESLLCAIIGRPCTIPNDQCTVPLPLGSSEGPSRDRTPPRFGDPVQREDGITTPLRPPSPDSSSRGYSDTVTRTSVLGARVTISLIVQEALLKLYSPQASVESWEQIQKKIVSLSNDLDKWVAAALPEQLKPANSLQECGVERERLLLSFQYHSAKLLVYRPCLCRIERRIQRRSNASAHFDQETAEACVQAAQSTTRLFPDEPDHAFVYQQSPWWSTVHNIMQAIAVFLLEISFRDTRTAQPDPMLLKSIKKLVRWLRFMSVSNVVARRAHEIVIDIVKDGAPRLGVDISDILGEEKVVTAPNQSFPTYQPPGETAFSWGHGDSSLQAEWDVPPSIDPSATADFSTQYPATLWDQQTAQSFGGIQPDQDFTFQPSLQVPPIFGNPFFTNFDFANPLSGGFSLDIDDTMDEA